MKNINFKALIPVIVAVLLFVGLTYGYFSPMLKDKVIVQSDMVLNKAMSKEISDFREQQKEEALWTNSMFGGMPAYQISIRYPNNFMYEVRTILTLGMSSPAMMLFNLMLGFFILLLILRVNPWLSIVGAIAYAFTAYTFIILDAGHITKAAALGYLPPLFGGVILVNRGKYLLGGALTALFFALELLCNHIQMTYYFFIFLLIYMLIEWTIKIKEKMYAEIGKGIAVFLVAGVIGVGCNFANLWSTYEYSKYTIRGPSELTKDGANQTSGVDKDYATQWSMGKAEVMTLMIPGFKGTSSNIPVSENKNALKDVDPQMKEYIGSMPQYWGDQLFTMSPYAGAIVIFLFVFGLFVVEGRMKWVLLAGTILSITLSWGKNMMWLTELFLDYFPMYNKFRAVSQILVIAEFCIPLLAILVVDKLIKNPGLIKDKVRLPFTKTELSVQNAFFISFGLTGGLSLLFYLMPTLTDFTSVADAQMYESIQKSNGAQVAQQVMDNVETARIALFKTDALRSFFFVVLGALVLWLYLKNKINANIMIPLLGLVILIDLWGVDKRHLDDKSFSDKKKAETPFTPSAADLAILEDKDPNYRVLNLAGPKEGPFNDAATSYFHKSVGGYHPAKLRRYQELIETHISANIQNIGNTLRSNPTDSALRYTFSKQGVLNMLNTKYIIYNPEAQPLQNRYALGNAWFVDEVKMVDNADQELATLGEIDPATTIVVDKRYQAELDGFKPSRDANAKIRLAEYKPNHLTYESKTSSEQLAVFSEVFYKDGWNVYVDGEKKTYFSGDWILRAMRVPAGEHKIEFKFEPTKYYTGEKISLVSCLVLFGMLGGAVVLGLRQKKD